MYYLSFKKTILVAYNTSYVIYTNATNTYPLINYRIL